MPFAKRSGTPSQIDEKLKTKRQKIIEEERIRVLKESLMLFYDKLMERYRLAHFNDGSSEGDEVQIVSREEVESYAQEYAETKPIGF